MPNTPSEGNSLDEFHPEFQIQPPAKTPELIIDLPFDQKITIQALKPNTVVEIVTWKGKGSPGDDSVRMLIGAALPGVIAEPQGSIDTTIEADFQSPHSMIPQESSNQPLNELLTDPPIFRERKYQMTARRNARRSLPNWAVALIALVAVATVIGGLNVSRVLAFDHPQIGPDLPFGNANTALMAIQPSGEPVVGGLGMAVIETKRHLVQVASVSEDSITVSTMNGSLEISRQSFSGPIAFVVPFVGYLWLPLGQ